jgi:MFS family permease
MDARTLGLRLNKRLMFFTRLFLELKSLNAVIQLFYLSRGLTISQIVYLSLVWSATVLLCDVPSSFLADKFGRKKLIFAGILLTSLQTFLMFFASGFSTFVFLYVIGAMGYSFFMGADHALIYDSLKELKEQSGANRVAGKYFASTSLAKIFVPFIGSLIAKDLLPWQFIILIGIDFAGSIISMIVATRLTEPKISVKAQEEFGVIRAGIKTILSDKTLFKIAMNKIIMFQAAFVYWRIYQVFLKGEGMPVVYLGAVYLFFQTTLFLAFWNAERLQKMIGIMNFVWGPQILGFAAVILSMVSHNFLVLFLSAGALLVVGTVRDPFFMSQIQARLKSFNRATTTSTLNTIKNISDIPLILLIGYLAGVNITYVLVISAFLFAAASALTPIERRDLKIGKGEWALT